MTQWFSKDTFPALYKEYWDFEYKSKPVLGCMKDGIMKIVFAHRYEDEDTVNWYSACSERWDWTHWITHWSELPEPPVK